MALLQCGISLLVLAVSVAGDMDCQNPWSPSYPGFVVDLEPFASLPEPHCCSNPPASVLTFDELQDACHLCYKRTLSTPGFAADPNNCAKYYICEPNDKGGFATFHMDCPMCTFWNQSQLACVQTWFDIDYCVRTGHQTDSVPYTTPIEDPKMFCIDFEDNDLISDTWGEYRPWLLNDGVTVVKSSDCPQGEKCGFFNESVLELPFFSNNYGQWSNLRITFEYNMIAFGNSGIQGIISNDCFPDGNTLNPLCNSLYVAADNVDLKAGLLDTAIVRVSVGHSMSTWNHAEMNWVGSTLVLQTGAAASPPVAFAGPIRESHCPLMIGAFIHERATSYFQGYMDNICFYKW